MHHAQGSEELKLSVDHIKQIICILRDFIRSPERRVMATTISKLKLDLDFDSTSINQIQLVLFGFQDSVSRCTGGVSGRWAQGSRLSCRVFLAATNYPSIHLPLPRSTMPIT